MRLSKRYALLLLACSLTTTSCILQVYNDGSVIDDSSSDSLGPTDSGDSTLSGTDLQLVAPYGLSYGVGAPIYLAKGVPITPITATLDAGESVEFQISPQLPAGLVLNSETGQVSGTPTTVSANTTYTVSATNSKGNITTQFELSVGDAPSGLSYGSSSFTWEKGQGIGAISPTLIAGTGTFSASNLPAGVSIDSTTGTLSGTPTDFSAAATYFVIVSNLYGQNSIDLSIAVNDVDASVTIDTNAGDNYTTSQQILVVSGTCSANVATISATLNNVTQKTSDSDCSNGRFSLRPTTLAMGANTFVVTVTNGTGQAFSDSIVVTYDSTKPIFSIITAGGADVTTSASTLTIKGECTNTITSIASNLGGTINNTCSAPVGNSAYRSWSITSIPLSIGANKLVLTASGGGQTTVSTQTIIRCASFDTITPSSSMSGSGTPVDPYLISTPADLAAIKDVVTGYFKLTRDIDLACYNWTYGAVNFSGTLDGAGFSIANLYGSGGLIANAINSATIKDLSVHHGRISGSALILGSGDGTVLSNVHASGIVLTDPNQVGGLVGSLTHSTTPGSINNSSALVELATSGSTMGGLAGHSTGNIHSSSARTFIPSAGTILGGLVGRTSASITESTSTGRIFASGSGYSGGLVGILEGAASVEGSTSSVSIFAGATGTGALGGLVGSADGTMAITNSSTASEIVGLGGQGIGGLVGLSETSLTISNSFSTGPIYATVATKAVGGLVGRADQVNIARSYSSSTIATSGSGSRNWYGGLGGHILGHLTIEDSFFSGNFSGTFTSHLGGLIGYMVTGAITRSYSSASVASGSVRGGIAGTVTTSLALSAAYANSTGSTAGALGAGAGTTSDANGYSSFLSSAGLKVQINFATYDFTNVWQITEGVTTPSLR